MEKMRSLASVSSWLVSHNCTLSESDVCVQSMCLAQFIGVNVHHTPDMRQVWLSSRGEGCAHD